MSLITSEDLTSTWVIIIDYKRTIWKYTHQGENGSLGAFEQELMELLQYILILEEEFKQQVILYFFELNEIFWPIFFEEIKTGYVVPPHDILLDFSHAFFEDGEIIHPLCEFL